MPTLVEGLQSTQTRDILGYMYQRLTQEPQGWVTGLGEYFSSDQAEEKHRWLGMAPELREMKDGRRAKKPNAYGIDVISKDFEGTLEFKKKDLTRDKTKQVGIRINDLVTRANNHWGKLASELINGAETAVCYDGQYWVDTDHNESGSNQSNDIGKTVVDNTALTVTEMVDAVLKNIEQMYGFKDDQGAPINQDVSEFLIMVPVSYWGGTQKAVKNELIGSGESNVLGNADVKLSVMMNPRLTWTNKMMIFAADSPTKSMILQDEDDIEITYLDGKSDFYHNTRKLQYGVFASRNVAPAFWQSCCMTTFNNAA